MRTFARILCSGLAAASLVASAAVHASPETYYAGKQIRIIIPFSPGGGTDTFGRLVGQYLGKHIPGNPTVISENVTGAGGLLGSNEFAERTKPDGLTLLTASGHLNLRAFLGLRGLKLDLDKLEPVVAAPMPMKRPKDAPDCTTTFPTVLINPLPPCPYLSSS